MNDPFAVVVSQDEVHFQVETKIIRMWYPKGSTPVVGSAPGRNAVPYSGFVILGKGNGQLFVTKPDWFTYETTIQAIRAFLAAYPMPECCQIYMILDNAPWHKKAKRLILDESNQEYEDIRSRVKFLDIPPYSPDLNPIEQVWRLTRREVTHNRYFPSTEALAACLDEYFKQFEHHTEKLANLCTFNFEKKNRKPKWLVQVGTFHAMKKMKDRCQTAIILWQENVPLSHRLDRVLTTALP